MLMLYLGGMIPSFLFFLVIMQPYASDRGDKMLMLATAMLVSLSWPLSCVYLLVCLYQRRR